MSSSKNPFHKELKPLLESVYSNSQKNIKIVRKNLKRPLTYTEKILFSHLRNPNQFKDEDRFLSLNPDRVIMQDATAQMAILQFMLAGKKKVTIPSTVHCDHLILAKENDKKDLNEAKINHQEVYDFLSSASSCYGIGFWKPGSGIIHQVVLENYAFPGGLIIGTDSHTPNAGGLGMVAIGVGGADATDVMASMPWDLKKPAIMGVHLKGKLQGWASSKDVILKLLGILTVKGGTNKIIEYFGEGCESISCTGKGTITNMGAELGATTSLFPFDQRMLDYLKMTQRGGFKDLINENLDILKADDEVLDQPEKFYERVIEIDLSSLEPHISGPHSPDFVRPLSQFKQELKKENWPLDLSAALIGSCTNSSYEDISRASSIATQAKAHGLKMPQPFLVSPGSEQIKQTIERDGFISIFNSIGAVVLANACGPCIGQWQRGIKKGEVNTIVNSFNRNFRGRNDANSETLSFIAGPELVIAMGLSGRLDFDPQVDSLKINGRELKLKPPVGEEFPKKGFIFDFEGYAAPKGEIATVKIKASSERLQILKPFSPWDGKDMENLLVLCKAKGKCTTDHISPAGYWLKYRGHLDKISDNLLLGANNAFRNEVGRGKNFFTGEIIPFFELARDYKKRNQSWVIVGDENYGEGSSREHAAMTPRFLGAKAVIVNSFARIHETNLKKQGILPLTFANKEDYKKIQEEDKISIKGLSHLSRNSKHEVVIEHKKGTKESFFVNHSMNADQIEWFKAGSSLNLFKSDSEK